MPTKETIEACKIKKQTVQKLLRETKKEVATANSEVELTQKVLDLVQNAVQAVQQQSHDQICDIVTEIFQAVYQKPWKFRINFEPRRGRTEASPVLVDESGVEYGIVGEQGGGYVDVVSFGLRVARLVLGVPPCRRLLILDEPFKWVDSNCRQNLIDIINHLATDLKIQFIIVTHIQEFQLGKVVTVTKGS